MTSVPAIGEDGLISEGRPLYIPVEVGLRHQPVEYTCIDASQQFLVVGSIQGYVWVVELHSSQLLREFAEFKGSAITVVKLNPVRDYFVYGTNNGCIQVERLSKIMPNKLHVQEKNGHCVSSLEWSQNGEDIFCGFKSGRLVQFNVKFSEGIMKHVPLYPTQYDSAVVQLAASNDLLLVSTLDRAFLLDTFTHKLNQVGRKERKSGMYGGCFLKEGQTMLLSRPGLRIWMADRFGKVLNTMTFKEALSTNHLPALVVNSIPTLPLHYSRSWQFSTLHPWLGGNFVVTFHNNTIFVLDPINGVLAGAAIFQDSIKSLSISGGFMYILTGIPSKALVRVAVHHSYVTMACEDHYLTTLCPAANSTSNSPIGSRESLLTDDKELGSSHVKKGGTASKFHEISMENITYQRGKKSELYIETQNTSEENCTSPSKITNVGMEQLSKMDVGEAENSKDRFDFALVQVASEQMESVECERTVKQKVALQVTEDFTEKAVQMNSLNEKLRKTSISELPKIKLEESKNRNLAEVHVDVLKPNCEPTDATKVNQRLKSKVDLGEVKEFFKPALDSLSDLLSISQTSDCSSQTIHKQDVTTRGDDNYSDEDETMNRLVANSDATLNLKVSLLCVKENSRRLRMSQAAGEEIVADFKSHRKRRKKSKGKKPSSAASSASVSMEKLTDIAEELKFQEEPSEVHIKHKQILTYEVQFPTDEASIEQQEFLISGNAIDEETEEKGIFPEEENPSTKESQCCDLDDCVRGCGDLEEDLSAAAIVLDEKVELKLIDDESGQQFSDDVFGTVDCLSAHQIDGPLCGEDVLDNPLYQDTDEEHGSDGISMGEDDAVEKQIHIITQNHHSLILQPAFSDPLRDEETLETGTNSARLRPISSPELLAHSPYLSSSPDLKACRTASSWMEVNKRSHCETDQDVDASDSSQDSGPDDIPGVGSIIDSQVVDDFYQLCGDLVENTANQQQLHPASHSNFSQASTSGSNSLSKALRFCETQEIEVISSDDKTSEEQSLDVWVSIPYPSRHSIQSVCLSDVLLWVVDSRCRVFCTTTVSRGRDWQQIKRTMQHVASSPSGCVVWSTYRQNAYVRLGIGMNPAGSTWKNVTKTTSLAHRVKQVAVEENGVWAITVDDRILFRKGVDERNPEGKVWQEVGYGANFTLISCCKSIVWALTQTGRVFVRDGITPSSQSGKKWVEIKTPKLIAVSITSNGVVWGINGEGSVGFRTGINKGKPGGRGPWWEVSLNADSPATSPLNYLWQVVSTDGGHLLTSAVSSLVSLPHHHRASSIAASSKAGVVVLESGLKLHGCWRMATGYHYASACKEGIDRCISWSRVAAGGTGLWFVRSDGDLYCSSPGDKLKRVEVPSSVELIAASPNCMWVISKDTVWSRQGMSAELPEGCSFDYIELSTLLHDKKLRSVACGKKVAWGIDSSGMPHFRFGVHAREPGTGMSPAWVPVEDDLPAPFFQITVCPDDWLVWACDEEYSVYARTGVTVDFPVGRKWSKIPKQKIKELAATGDRMYGLSPSGELMCRHGISKNNVQGTFWRKLPGKYEHITTGPFGELWTLDSKGQVWKQEWKVIRVSDVDFDSSMVADPESWEFV